MAGVEVRHQRGDLFLVQVRDHVVMADQPESGGGTDLGPTPTELFVAGLAACVAFYAGRFLRRHGVAAEGLRVDCDYSMAERPSRVGSVDLRIVPPDGLPEERREALLRVARHCTVHNSIRQAPEVRIELGLPDRPG